MLILKRMIHPYEVMKCKVSGEFIVYGDFYYEDDEDKNVVVKATVYKKMQQEARDAAFDYSLLAKRAERDYLRATILDRPIFDQGHVKRNGVE